MSLPFKFGPSPISKIESEDDTIQALIALVTIHEQVKQMLVELQPALRRHDGITHHPYHCGMSQQLFDTAFAVCACAMNMQVMSEHTECHSAMLLRIRGLVDEQGDAGEGLAVQEESGELPA